MERITRTLRSTSRLMVAIVSLSAGAVCAGVGQAAALPTLPDSTYTQPSLRVEVAPTRSLNVFCIGTGRPTVLLDAGAGLDMLLWRHVQEAAAKATRVCAYDRAGYGFSDPMGAPLDADHVAEDIHRLVRTAAVPGPVIYVGHSIAGLYAVRLQATHPEDLLGVVLVDPAFVGQFESMTSEFSAASTAKLLGVFAQRLATLRQCSDLASVGALSKAKGERFRSCVSASDYPERLDANLRTALERQNREPKVASALSSEYSHLLPQLTMTTVNDREIGDKPVSFGDKPLIILSHGNAEALLPETSVPDTARSTTAWRAGHAALARTSRRGSVRVIAAAGHFIQLDDPRAVIDAISDLTLMVRNGVALQETPVHGPDTRPGYGPPMILWKTLNARRTPKPRIGS